MTAADQVFLPEVPINTIVPCADNPREPIVTDEALTDLAESITAQGILEPLLVTLQAGSELGDDEPRFELIAGHRRHAAALHAGLTTVPVLLRTDLDAKGVAQARLVENLHRKDLNPIEEARGMAQLINDHGMTQVEVAVTIGRNQGNVSRKLTLLNLVDQAQGHVATGRIGSVDGYNLARLPEDRQREVIRDYEKNSGIDFKRAINMAESRQKVLDQVAEACTMLTKDGIGYVEVTDESYPPKHIDNEKGPVPLRTVMRGRQLTGEVIAEHNKGECAFAFVHHQRTSDSWMAKPIGADTELSPVDLYVEWACSDPAAHDVDAYDDEPIGIEPGSDETSEQRAEREAQAAAAMAERAERERIATGREVTVEARRAFIRENIIGGRAPKGAAEHVLRSSLLLGIANDDIFKQAHEDDYRLAAWFLGVDADGLTIGDVMAIFAETVAEKGDKLSRAALAVELARGEAIVGHMWDQFAAFQREAVPSVLVKHHLDYLISQGYEPTEFEQPNYDAALGPVEFADQEWRDETERLWADTPHVDDDDAGEAEDDDDQAGPMVDAELDSIA